MHPSFYRFARTYLAALLLALAAPALAQNESIVTGTIVAVVDGTERTSHVYYTVAVSEGVRREAHSAAYTYVDEMRMGDLVLVPAHNGVSILTYNTELENSFDGAWEFYLPLDAHTLEVTDWEDVRVTYYPDGRDLGVTYVLTQGELKLNPVVVDDTTLAISGTIQGLVSRQESYYPEHNADDYFTVDATFEFRRVVDTAAWIGR